MIQKGRKRVRAPYRPEMLVLSIPVSKCKISQATTRSENPGAIRSRKTIASMFLIITHIQL